MWNSNESHPRGRKKLLGQVVTYQTMAEKSLIPGTFQPYVDQTSKIREFTAQANVVPLTTASTHSWSCWKRESAALMNTAPMPCGIFAYRVTPDEFHARDRHVRAKGADTGQGA